MHEKIIPNPVLQTFYVSRETSNCPLISEMIKLGKKLQEVGLIDAYTGAISFDYGKRLLINAKDIDLTLMKQQDVVEIVDYDLLKNVMMVIGTKDPCLETPVHWVIQKARHDINAVLQINAASLYEKLQGVLPSTEIETKPNTFESTREILKTLRMSKTILIKNQGILFGGINITEIQDSVQKYLGGLK